jgi:Ca2+:H+ antiporter
MGMPLWTWLLPLVAMALLVTGALIPIGAALAILCSAALIGAVIASVHHAEVVAHRLGEPFGTLVLTASITVIEVALIVTLMLGGGAQKSALPRDTIFSAIMITCNAVVGLCLVIGGLRHREQSFHIVGTNTALATLIALSTLSLVFPAFTTSSAGSTYSPAQLAFAAMTSLALWSAFVFVQTVRHRDYFLPVENIADEQSHAPGGRPPPILRQTLFSTRQAWASLGLLFVSLVAVVGLSKVISHNIEGALEAAGAPPAVLGIIVAMLVLLPETSAAVRAAYANRLQTSLNLALGSALSSIGLTIPVVALTATLVGMPLVLGVEPKELVLLVLTFLVASITLASGRTHVLLGAVHLVIFAAFLFLALVP